LAVQTRCVGSGPHQLWIPHNTICPCLGRSPYPSPEMLAKTLSQRRCQICEGAESRHLHCFRLSAGPRMSVTKRQKTFQFIDTIRMPSEYLLWCRTVEGDHARPAFAKWQTRRSRRMIWSGTFERKPSETVVKPLFLSAAFALSVVGSDVAKAEALIFPAPVVVYPVAPPPAPKVVVVPPMPVIVAPMRRPRLVLRRPAPLYGAAVASKNHHCSSGTCTAEVTRTGPKGNSMVRSGSASCADGVCSRTQTVTGPNGKSGSVNRTISR
jgi:hypothetical protein